MQGAAILFSLSEPYKVVRIEAPSIHDRPLTALAVVPRLRSREGKFALKYFRTDGREGSHGEDTSVFEKRHLGRIASR